MEPNGPHIGITQLREEARGYFKDDPDGPEKDLGIELQIFSSMPSELITKEFVINLLMLEKKAYMGREGYTDDNNVPKTDEIFWKLKAAYDNAVSGDGSEAASFLEEEASQADKDEDQTGLFDTAVQDEDDDGIFGNYTADSEPTEGEEIAEEFIFNLARNYRTAARLFRNPTQFVVGHE